MPPENKSLQFGTPFGKVCARALALTLLLLLLNVSVSGQSQIVSPSTSIETFGVPPIPASLAADLKPYSGIYGLPLAQWDPLKHEVLLKGLSSVTWISRVPSPGATQLTSIYIQSSGIYDIYFQPQGKYLAYTRDAEGNETFQLYLYEIGTAKTTILSDGKTRSTEPVWSNAGDKIIYSSSPSGVQGVSLRSVLPSDPKTDHLFVSSAGGYFKAYDWSPDDKQVVYCDFASNVASSLWLVDVASGNKTLISPKSDQPELYDNPQFSKDGKGIFVVTDHDSDFRRLAYIDTVSRKISYIPSTPRWDVDEFQLGPDGKTLAFVTNEDGISRLHLFDVIAGKERRAPPQLPVGVISDLKWRRNSTDLAFNFKSSKTPNDVYAVNTDTGKVDLWAKSVTNGFETEKLSEPELIHWTSFDKSTLSGFLYRPPSKFKGKRPVIIDIHGGPEEQYRPGFIYENNYFLNELGVAKIYPNVRGSLGYGKAFSHLDDGIKREGAVKDIGALLDWIKRQPDLDAERVMVQGGSYGGYLALSAAYTYPNRIKAVASDSGITDLVSCAEHTEDWRRGLQRTEFGDERDPKIRKFMERTAPLKNADKIKSALLISHGQNDPRVPVAEAASLVAATKNRVPVWYIMAKDEGHGFTQRNNRDYRLYASILFVKEFLLK